MKTKHRGKRGQAPFAGTARRVLRTKGASPLPPQSYVALIRRFPLRPIRSDAELDRAIAVIDSLIDRPKLNAADADYLDVLSDLVERYEEAHHAIEPAADAAMLAHLLESKQVTQLAVTEATGIANSTLSAVLNGKRRLTREHVARLAKFFQVDPSVFALDVGGAANGKGRRRQNALARV